MTCVCVFDEQARTCNLHARPVARRQSATPTMLVERALATLPNVSLASDMAVTFPAYLAIFLGTLIPCAFLIILYIQDASRKAGEKSSQGEE